MTFVLDASVALLWLAPQTNPTGLDYAAEILTALKDSQAVVPSLLAPEIANEHSNANWKIGRTSLKTRNSDNAPDAWERSVLEQFAERAANGEDATTISYAETVNGQFRLMKAIPLQEGCLGCHGNDIKPPIAEALNAKYPNDQATGYALGDIRGAFTLRHLGAKE